MDTQSSWGSLTPPPNSLNWRMVGSRALRHCFDWRGWCVPSVGNLNRELDFLLWVSQHVIFLVKTKKSKFVALIAFIIGSLARRGSGRAEGSCAGGWSWGVLGRSVLARSGLQSFSTLRMQSMFCSSSGITRAMSSLSINEAVIIFKVPQLSVARESFRPTFSPKLTKLSWLLPDFNIIFDVYEFRHHAGGRLRLPAHLLERAKRFHRHSLRLLRLRVDAMECQVDFQVKRRCVVREKPFRSVLRC